MMLIKIQIILERMRMATMSDKYDVDYVIDALITVTDACSYHDIVASTGVSEDRAKEILRILSWANKNRHKLRIVEK
jgi:hypothetical protein